ncbi:unnamed protein product [Penicillium salamii]|uniref:HNH nuclease domain-containing protein n=1 Tax=Penicillium salamii TaxID=1612424 RepID=A0A9W4IF58_9EURO|nr:unnamed protein product [Penicillium salamii]
MEKVNAYHPIGPDDNTVAILRAFNEYLPANGRVNFLHDLQSLRTNQLYDHAQSLINGLVAPFRWLPLTPSVTPVRYMSPRWNYPDDDLTPESAESKQREARLRTECLARDDNRCAVTGFPDEELLDPSIKTRTAYTDCVHIIPLALSSWSTESEGHAKDIIWTNLARHFPTLQSMNFTRENISSITNRITMSNEMHYHFRRFDISFEETSRPHKYRIQKYRPRLISISSLFQFVKFKSYDQRYDLPSPELFKVHAILARIFHASGAAEQIEKALGDRYRYRMLARDGSTDVSSILAVTTLGVFASGAGNVQQTGAAFRDSETGAQSVQKSSVTNPKVEDHVESSIDG